MAKYIDYCDRRIPKKWVFKTLTIDELLKMFPKVNKKIIEKIDDILIDKENKVWFFDKKAKILQISKSEV